jgi:hypothetical protein
MPILIVPSTNDGQHVAAPLHLETEPQLCGMLPEQQVPAAGLLGSRRAGGAWRFKLLDCIVQGSQNMREGRALAWDRVPTRLDQVSDGDQASWRDDWPLMLGSQSNTKSVPSLRDLQTRSQLRRSGSATNLEGEQPSHSTHNTDGQRRTQGKLQSNGSQKKAIVQQPLK